MLILKIIAWTIISGYALITLLYLFRLVVFAAHLRGAKKLTAPKDMKKELVYVLPMYKEQKLAKETFEFFVNIAKSRPNSKVIFVTTCKEKSTKTQPSTFEILNNCINDDNKEYVRLYDYPHTQGVMAHQVNYGVKMYYDENPNKDLWIAIYNCDSRLSEESLNEIYYNVNKANADTVFQQYSYYFIPDKKVEASLLAVLYGKPGGVYLKKTLSLVKKILYSIGILETKNFNHLLNLSHTVLDMDVSPMPGTFIECGGMPEDTINEDCFLGYVFNCENKRIVPLYNLEKAESVPTTKALIKQQTSWYNGPVASLDYYKHYKNGCDSLLKRPLCKESETFRAKVLALKSFNYAIHWICSPFLLLVALPISLSIIYGAWGLLITLAVAEIYLFGINILMYWYLRTQKIKIPHPSLIFDILFYICHGISAVIWVFKQMCGKNSINNKYKTEIEIMKICIVTGSTGALGQDLVSELKLQDYSIISIGRSKNDQADYNIIVDFGNINISKLQEDLNEIIASNDVESIDLVHCAGVYNKETDNPITNQEILINSYNVNTFSFYTIVNVLAEFWERTKSGSVVAVSSNLTKLKNKNTAIYISSKMALQGMIESFAQTYGNLNVRFNTICPGMFPSKLNGYNVPDTFKANSPLGRICETDDIKQLIMFLLSDNSKCITAQNIIIDGGNSNGY